MSFIEKNDVFNLHLLNLAHNQIDIDVIEFFLTSILKAQCYAMLLQCWIFK